MNPELFETLQALVDEESLSTVLDTLSLICFARSELLETKRDLGAAVWREVGDLIAKLSARVDI